MDRKQQGGGQATDYADSLEPGYRFCPTDSELIVYYLKPKIEKKVHPRCRFYDVNIYDYHPKELAEEYKACEDKWYFLTPREPRYSKGKRPNRRTKDDGTWRASQRYTTVKNSNRQVVGLKRSLAYFENHVNKTEWLMHEYTTTENKMSDCVLCKIYKKETSETKKNRAIQDTNTRNQQEKNQEPSPIRRRISGNQLQEKNQHNEPQQVQINQEVNHYEIVQDQLSVKSSPNQSMEVPQVVDEDDGFDEILSLLDEDNAVDEIDTDSNQFMEVPKDNDEDEIAKLMAMFDKDDAEDEIDKNSKQSMEVPQVDNEGDEFDEIMTLLDAEDEIYKESNQSMEVPKDNDEDNIGKLMAQFDEDDAEDEFDKNSKKSMEVAEHDIANELDKEMARSEDKDVSKISYARSDCVEVFSLDDLFSH